MIQCRAPIEKIEENGRLFLKKNYSLKGGFMLV